MIDHATVEKIKNTADIVDVVSDYVHLIRRGANYMGLCPFHNERTPSFSVNRQRNFCYCFSCKKGGSPVNFIMEKEGLNYHEALLHLAKKYGIEVVERELTDEERERQSAREAMFVANEWAMQKMQKDMLETDEGRDIGLQYLVQRGVTDEAIKAFHLGYALDKGTALTDAARKAGFRLEVFTQLGLVGTSKEGRNYDRFRGRVIFPILNNAGKVIAFGGRDLKGGLAKYINSPESDIYKKSNELYGIFQAKSSIVNEHKCFLVEGYMDVIGMWQSGMKNVVASSGTALTDGQIAMIHRFTDNITLIYDGDAAGIKASLRGIDMLLNHRLNVKVLLLPDGDDPDSFARKHTPEEFKTYVAEHETDIIRYKAQVMLNEVKQDPQRRISAINSVVESIAHIPDQVARDVYVQECSEILDIPEATIAKSVAKVRAALVERFKQERLRKEYSQPAAQPSGSAPTPSSGSAPTASAQPQGSPSAQPQGSPSAQPGSPSAQPGSPSAQPGSPSAQSGFPAAQPGSPSAQSGSPAAQPPQQLGSNTVSGSLVAGSQTAPSAGPQPAPAVDYRQSPLYPFELSVIKYCLRYGFLAMCSYEANPDDPNSPIISLNVLDYVKEELADSDMAFSIEIFSRMFRLLHDLRPDFQRYLEQCTKDIDLKCDKMRQDGYNKIAEAGASTAEIKREEAKLEEKISGMREEAIREVAKDYPGRVLGSHEDADIRQLVLELMFDKHHLSNIYLKDPSNEREEDRLNVLLVRAINEWKEGLINLRIRDLVKQLQAIAGKGDSAEEQRLQLELKSLLTMRSEIAKYIGDRIITKT